MNVVEELGLGVDLVLLPHYILYIHIGHLISLLVKASTTSCGLGMMPPSLPEMPDGDGVVDRQAHVFYHLPCVKLHAKNPFLPLCGFPDRLFREGHSVMGRTMPTFIPCSRHHGGFRANPGHRSESHDQIVGLIHLDLFPSRLRLADLLVAVCRRSLISSILLDSSSREVMTLRFLSPSRPLAASGTLPTHLLFRAAWTLLGKHHLLHHLPDDAVGKNHGRSAIFKRQVESKANEVHHLLHSRRSQHDEMIVAVSAPFVAWK